MEKKEREELKEAIKRAQKKRLRRSAQLMGGDNRPIPETAIWHMRHIPYKD